MKKLIYYSRYFYNRPDEECPIIEIEGGATDYYDFPYRLYKAAECEDIGEHSWEEFIANCYEAMDRPDLRVKGYKYGTPFIDSKWQVKVSPTSDFYGATNSVDGVYCYKIEDAAIYAVVRSHDNIIKFTSWKDAVNYVFNRRECPKYWPKGIDYIMEK